MKFVKEEKSQEENYEEIYIKDNEDNKKDIKLKNSYECPKCSKIFRNPRTLKSHLSNDCEKEYECKRCKKKFCYRSSYCRHKKCCNVILRKRNRI